MIFLSCRFAAVALAGNGRPKNKGLIASLPWPQAEQRRGHLQSGSFFKASFASASVLYVAFVRSMTRVPSGFFVTTSHCFETASLATQYWAVSANAEVEN